MVVVVLSEGVGEVRNHKENDAVKMRIRAMAKTYLLVPLLTLLFTISHVQLPRGPTYCSRNGVSGLRLFAAPMPRCPLHLHAVFVLDKIHNILVSRTRLLCCSRALDHPSEKPRNGSFRGLGNGLEP